MSLTVTRSRVKEKCGIADTSLDTTIDNLITELVPVIEYSIRDEHLNDTGNAGLQATLSLGATEIVCSEILAQTLRPPGAGESIVIAGLSLGAIADADAPSGLKAQGLARLLPYLKPDPSDKTDAAVVGACKPHVRWP